MKKLLLVLLMLSFSSYAIENCPVIPKDYNPLELDYDVHESFLPHIMKDIRDNIEAGFPANSNTYRYSKEYKVSLKKYMTSGNSSKEICDNATRAAIECSWVNMAGAELIWDAIGICRDTLNLSPEDEVQLDSKETNCINEIPGDYSIARYERASCILHEVKSFVK